MLLNTYTMPEIGEHFCLTGAMISLHFLFPRKIYGNSIKLKRKEASFIGKEARK